MKKNNKQIQHKVADNEKIRIPLALCIVFTIPVLLYLQTLSFGFTHFDDDNIIINNKSFLKDIRNSKQAFLTDAFIIKASRFYRPLQTITYIIDTQFTKGDSATMYHFTNVLLLGLIACALFMLLKQFLQSTQLAIIGSLIYCTHPLFVSTVAWIPARGDLLLALFSMLSLLFLIDYLQKGKLLSLSFNLLTFVLALLCKETAIMLPFLFIGYYIAFIHPKQFKTTYLFIIAFYTISILLWLWLRSVALSGYNNIDGMYGVLAIASNGSVLLESLTKFIVPFDFSPIPQYSILSAICGCVILGAICYLLFKNRERSLKEKLFWTAWFVTLLIPTMLYKSALFDYLDHRFFLPMIGVLLLLLYIIPKRWFTNGQLNKPWILIAAIILLSSLTAMKSRMYANQTIFYNAAIDYNNHSAMAYFNRGIIKTDANDNIGAIADYTQAVTTRPDYADAYVNRGVSESNIGKQVEAIADYTKAISIRASCQTYYNRGIIKSKIGDNIGAIDDYTLAIKLFPNYSEAYHNRGLTYETLGNIRAAFNDYSQAIIIKSDDVDDYINRGTIKAKMGDNKGAIDDYSQAIAHNPNFAEAYNNRGITKANMGDRQSAIADYTKAISLNKNYAEAYNNRGISQSLIGNYQDAINDFTQTIAFNPNHLGAFTNRAIARYSIKDYAGAIYDCNKILSIHSNDETALYIKSNAQRGLAHK